MLSPRWQWPSTAGVQHPSSRPFLPRVCRGSGPGRSCGCGHCNGPKRVCIAGVGVASSPWTDEFSSLDDRKDVPPLPLPSVNASKRVVLVRHGQSTWNAEGRIQGSSDDSVLTEFGEAQAHTTREMVTRKALLVWNHSGLIDNVNFRMWLVASGLKCPARMVLYRRMTGPCNCIRGVF